jgi:hypothetical protein
MSPSLRFQILSDLHLETPLTSPSYAHLTIPICAPNLFLLGDIGLTTHPQLFTFLSSLLTTHPSLHIFYVLGNHEPYHTTLDLSTASLEAFETSCQEKHGGRFHFLNRTRFDISPEITILGCTLWTHIPSSSSLPCATLLTDFNEEKGIWDRSIEQHNLDHVTDLSWLNTQISLLPPSHQIIVLTHHSPTIDPRANSQRHRNSETNAGFRTDLSAEVCWTDKRVKMWAFGHTHFSCQYKDQQGKLVVSNQMGYSKKEARVVVVEAGGVNGGGWRVVVGEKEERGEKKSLVDGGGGRVMGGKMSGGTSGDVVKGGLEQEQERRDEEKLGKGKTRGGDRPRTGTQEPERSGHGDTSNRAKISKWQTAAAKLKKVLHQS